MEAEASQAAGRLSLSLFGWRISTVRGSVEVHGAGVDIAADGIRHRRLKDSIEAS